MTCPRSLTARKRGDIMNTVQANISFPITGKRCFDMERVSVKRANCLYRVSTKKQVDNQKDDIPMQKKECHEFAEKNGWVIVNEYYEKGISGYKVSANCRDAVQDLKDAALNGEFDVLLVYMFDRLGRIDSETPFIVEWFAEQGIEVWSTQEGQQRFENQTDKLINYMRFWQANGESVKTSIRVKTVMKQLTEEGIYHGGVTPFGYRTVDTGRKNKKGHPVHDIEIDPKESMYVKMIFDKTVNDGYGSHRMAEYLNQLGIKTHNGSRFQCNTINRILNNRMYCGYFTSKDTVSPKIEKLVIVDENIFELAQKILKQRSNKNEEKHSIARTTKGQTLLSGNIYCGHCGSHLIASGYTDKHIRKDGTEMRKSGTRYVCYHRTRRLNDCDGQSVYLSERIDAAVEKAVLDYLEKVKDNPRDRALDIRYKNEIRQRKQIERELVKKKDELDKQLNELSLEIGRALVGKGRFSADVLSASIESTKAGILDVEQELRKCQYEIEEKKGVFDKLDFYYDQFVSWADEYMNADKERKKMIICQLIDEIKVSRGYVIEIKFNICYEQFFA